MKYLILKAWSDKSEDIPDDAFGYRPFAIAETENEAKAFCEKAGFVTKEKFGWAAHVGKKIYLYEKIPSLIDMISEIQVKSQNGSPVMCELWVTKGFMIELRHRPPNWFHRKMQEWIFGFRYVLKKK